MIPSELGEANRSYIKTAFVGSDRGQPSLVYLVVIPTGTEDTSALEGGLKLLESASVDYLAAPADATEGELTALNQWVADQRARYRTVKLVRPFGSKGSDSMGGIELDGGRQWSGDRRDRLRPAGRAAGRDPHGDVCHLRPPAGADGGDPPDRGGADQGH